MSVHRFLFFIDLLLATVFGQPSTSAASLFLAERWYEKPLFPNSGYEARLESTHGFRFSASQNALKTMLSVFIRYTGDEPLSPGLPDRVEIEFYPDGTLEPGPAVYDHVTDDLGPPPHLRYALSTAGVTNFVGQFKILELAYAADGTIASLAFDFLISSPSINVRQYDRGRLRINSSIPIPEPYSAPMLAAGTILAFGAFRMALWRTGTAAGLPGSADLLRTPCSLKS